MKIEKIVKVWFCASWFSLLGLWLWNIKYFLDHEVMNLRSTTMFNHGNFYLFLYILISSVILVSVCYATIEAFKQLEREKK